MNKLLFVATSDIHTATFHLPFIQWLVKNGWQVDVAFENRGNIKIPCITNRFELPFPRGFSKVYWQTYLDLKNIIDKENYSVVYCHTPLPSFISRLAARKARRNETKVLYMAHGFHFFKHSPIKNWLIYYPVEWTLSHFTDGIITMNSEDFGYIIGKMGHKNSFLIPGMGVDPDVYFPMDSSLLQSERAKLGLENDDIVILYVAEFSDRKNHRVLMDALITLIPKYPKIKVLFAGQGPLLMKMKQVAISNQLQNNIQFLGFRKDIPLLTAIADIGVSTSRSEGLPIGILQNMACGLPIVATIERGHNELVKHGENGFLFPQNDAKGMIPSLELLVINASLRAKMGKKSLELSKKFTVDKAVEAMAKVFNYYKV